MSKGNAEVQSFLTHECVSILNEVADDPNHHLWSHPNPTGYLTLVLDKLRTRVHKPVVSGDHRYKVKCVEYGEEYDCPTNEDIVSMLHAKELRIIGIKNLMLGLCETEQQRRVINALILHEKQEDAYAEAGMCKRNFIIVKQRAFKAIKRGLKDGVPTEIIYH